jgi:hypothetical protein
MTLGKAALILLLGGIAMFVLGFLGMVREEGLCLHHETTLGAIMNGVMVVGIVVGIVGVLLGVARLMGGPPRISRR